MNDKEEKERFKNLITTGSYSTDDELSSFMGIVILLGILAGLFYAVYRLIKG